MSNPESLIPTPNHPFSVTERSDAAINPQPRPKPQGHEDLNSNWVSAGHLKIGDKIKQADGTIGVVANVTTVQQIQEMFNLTVSEAHTFYVGRNGWLVHNVSGDCLKGLSKGSLPSSFYQNQYKTVSRDGLQDALHANKHGMPKDTQVDILNNWERSFTGVNDNGNAVQVYMKNGMIVITEYGGKSRVITAYGGRYSSNGAALTADRWADPSKYTSGEWYWSFSRNTQR